MPGSVDDGSTDVTRRAISTVRRHRVSVALATRLPSRVRVVKFEIIVALPLYRLEAELLLCLAPTGYLVLLWCALRLAARRFAATSWWRDAVV